jgi:hypothetical protein
MQHALHILPIAAHSIQRKSCAFDSDNLGQHLHDWKSLLCIARRRDMYFRCWHCFASSIRVPFLSFASIVPSFPPPIARQLYYCVFRKQGPARLREKGTKKGISVFMAGDTCCLCDTTQRDGNCKDLNWSISSSIVAELPNRM